MVAIPIGDDQPGTAARIATSENMRIYRTGRANNETSERVDQESFARSELSLPADLDGMLLQQEPGGERWTEVGVLRSHQLDHIFPYAGVPLAVRGSASSLVDQRSASAFLVSRQQPKGLTHTQRQHCRRRHHRAPPGQNFCQYLYSLQIPLTHRYQSHPVSVTSNGRDHDISNGRLQIDYT